MKKQENFTVLRMVLVLALLSAKTTEAEPVSVETLAQRALNNYKQKRNVYPAHKIELHESDPEWDEYKLKSSDGKLIVLRKYPTRVDDLEEYVYRIFQFDGHGVAFEPIDASLRKILQENKIENSENYVGTQRALKRYTQNWNVYPAHKIELHGTQSNEWDEYKLKSSNGKMVLRRFSGYTGDSEKNAYQIFQINNHGVASKPSDESLRKILRENDIADLKDYVGVLEELERYKKNNIKVILELKNRWIPDEFLYFALSQRNSDVGYLRIFRQPEPRLPLLTGELKEVAADKVAYFDMIKVEKNYQGLGLSYPLMCVAFYAVKEVFGSEYVLLQDAADERPGIYEKLGFKLLTGGTLNRKWAPINTLLNNDRCQNMNR